MNGLDCYITTKINGKSCSVLNFGGEDRVCGRRGQMRNHPASEYWAAVNRYDILSKVKDGRFCVQGEVAGPGIQKNQMGLDELDFFCFDVYDIKAGRYLACRDLAEFCLDHQLKMVPDLQMLRFNFTLDQLLRLAEGEYESGYPREGIVVRPMTEHYSATLKGRLSFKVLNNRHLLNEK
jgi:RNA ligase (TIGR02306 family)